ncbi:endonuclease III domain-containing protein [Pseudodesulfovibrio sp. F-1]|uniref:Endonuclease III domain-containing protein n=1 Tax=Pseudodesulfovibrio alkaliphilus TaxID=2661613 RepID=A0A7K1KQJ2_9BACT|nr:endonuclease III domain-containing protein [Pseudodesulfovibrio alkaliphilus]MUM78230.1 endonuclease III domain-containing protein [Pseudodesulfovibrio alkaliphilus]
MNRAAIINGMYEAMHAALGPSRWWPGDTPFEIAVGAILTQNTNWGNVEKAIANLKARELLSARAMLALDPAELAGLIRPAGYYNIKTARLRNFLFFLKDEAAFEIESLKVHVLDELRDKLLAVSGIGPETADSILLYALEMPTFVVDAYTHRLMRRHGLVHDEIDYHELRALFMDALPEDVALYNEYHALIVRTGKEWCRKKTGLCAACPLQPFLDICP